MEFKTPKKCSYSETKLTIPPSPFLKKIGYGTGVAVYEFQRSPLRDKFRSPWAVKKLLQKNKSNLTLNERLKEEANILRQLNHKNVVGFRAFISDGAKSVLAMEECSRSLGDAIEERFENTEQPFPENNIRKVASDIGEALNYLHNKALLLHADIKSYNVLIKDDFGICKLCDFGVCLPLDKEGNLDKQKLHEDNAEYLGTFAWNPPEVLEYPQIITSKADIYSYGLIIWEMIALMPPVVDDAHCSLNSSMGDEGKPRTRPDLPSDVNLGDEYNFVLELYFICTEYNYKNRPSAKDLCETFKGLV